MADPVEPTGLADDTDANEQPTAPPPLPSESGSLAPAGLEEDTDAGAATDAPAPPPVPPQPRMSGPLPSVSGPLPSLPSMSGALPAMSGPLPSLPLSPTGEFGIIPNLGRNEQQAVQEVQAVSASTTWFVTSLIAALVMFAVARAAVAQWMSPSSALLWAAIGVGFPTLLFCALFARGDDRAPRALLRATLPAGVLTAAAVALATVWAAPGVRAAAVPFAPDEVLAMEAILTDHDAVATAGCQRFATRHNDPDWRAPLFGLLSLRPSVATPCLNELPEADRRMVASSLLDRWSRELLTDEQLDEERTCATAIGVLALPLSHSTTGAHLLQCTLTAPSLVAQSCCGTALAATVKEPAQLAAQLEQSELGNAAAGVFAMAFHQQNLTEPQRKFAADINFMGARAQRVALDYACGALDAQRTEVAMHMRATLDGSCPLATEGTPRDASMWRQVCDLALTELAADPTVPPASVLCSTTVEVATDFAVDAAQRLVELAIRKQGRSSAADEINAGYVALLRTTDAQNLPDYVDRDHYDYVQRTQSHERRSQENGNYKYADPGDNEIVAYLKARQALGNDYKFRNYTVTVTPNSKAQPAKKAEKKAPKGPREIRLR